MLHLLTWITSIALITIAALAIYKLPTNYKLPKLTKKPVTIECKNPDKPVHVTLTQVEIAALIIAAADYYQSHSSGVDIERLLGSLYAVHQLLDIEAQNV